MYFQSFAGLVSRLAKSPIFLILFLALLPIVARREKTVTNVPTDLKTAMEKAFQGTPYQEHLMNWLAVSKMETDRWTSPVYKMANNPWGMRPSVERDHSQTGILETKSNGKFAKYDSLEQAARDIVLYMKAKRWPTQKMDLYTFITHMKQRGYFIEPLQYYYDAVDAQLER